MIPLYNLSDIPNSLEISRHTTSTRSSVDIYGNEWSLLKITDSYDRATRDVLNEELSTEGSNITCQTAAGEDINISITSDTTVIDGGTLSASAYQSQKILTDWISSIDGIDCSAEVDVATTSNCHYIDGAFFITSNIPNSYIWDTTLQADVPPLTGIDIDAGIFTDKHCDEKLDGTPGDRYEIDSKLSLFTLDSSYYESTLIQGTSGVVSNDIFSKHNTETGQLYCRDNVEGKIFNIELDSEHIVDIGIDQDILTVRTDTKNTHFYRIENQVTSSGPTIVRL